MLLVFCAQKIATISRLTVDDVDLDSTGIIERSIGRTVPVIVHELEYYEAIARQTEAANPPGLADEFTSWVRNG